MIADIQVMCSFLYSTTTGGSDILKELGGAIAGQQHSHTVATAEQAGKRYFCMFL